MFINIKTLLVSTILFTLAIQSTTYKSEAVQLSTYPNKETQRNTSIKPKIITLRGKLIYEELPGVMSARAYRGEEFFLIINLNKQKLVLRPSAKVSYSQLKAFHNRQVEITAIYVKGSRPSTESSCPVDINGQCLPQGEGYQVLTIKAKK